MSKVLRCRDAGMDCDFEARAETEDEVMSVAAQHASEAHGMAEIPAEMAEKIRGLIQDE